MKVHTEDKFKKVYKGNTITSFTVKATPSQVNFMEKNMKSLVVNPGQYFLFSKQCASTATNTILQAGIRIGYRPEWSTISPYYLNPGGADGVSPNDLMYQLRQDYNSYNFYNERTFIVR